LLGLIPLLGAVLASELPFFSGGSSGSPEAARSAATAPPAAAIVVTAAAKPTLQAIPAPPQATTGPTPIGSNPAAAAAPTRSPATAPTAANAAGAAAPTAVPTNAAPQANAPFIAYRVQPGDTVRSIATTYGVTPSTISNASGLANPDRLQVGQVLTVPAQPGYLYRVQPGETLDQIAARTGIASDTIATVSRVSIASVRPGDVLLIPEQAAAKSK
jgi:LysM repeat protein